MPITNHTHRSAPPSNPTINDELSQTDSTDSDSSDITTPTTSNRLEPSQQRNHGRLPRDGHLLDDLRNNHPQQHTLDPNRARPRQPQGLEPVANRHVRPRRSNQGEDPLAIETSPHTSLSTPHALANSTPLSTVRTLAHRGQRRLGISTNIQNVSFADLYVERGHEFKMAGNTLRSNPALTMGSIHYQTNGRPEEAIDAGGPLREFISNAYAQGLAAITQPSPDQEGHRALPTAIDATELNNRSETLNDFGRLLAYVVDEPKVNISRSLPEHLISTIVTLAENPLLTMLSRYADTETSVEAINTILERHPTLVTSLVEATLPESTFNHYKEALDDVCTNDGSKRRVDDAQKDKFAEQLDELKTHLVKVLGIAVNADSSGFAVAKKSAQLPQLLLIAQGFREVKDARTTQQRSHYPTALNQYPIALHGTGDIRRALGDPTYVRALTVDASNNALSETDIQTFKKLVHLWANSATDETLKDFCHAVTGSDILPATISNSTNGLGIHITNTGNAEFLVRSCFGTINLSTKLAQDIVQHYQEDPTQVPDQLTNLLNTIASERERFNSM